ncbi:MFS transporter [Streptomyces sp. NPDC127038]|uniref:MFS transporter n=1 Tax=Streptomyces sp. NPDC127038 TaxID=3347114 RepID=UPI00365568F8
MTPDSGSTTDHPAAGVRPGVPGTAHRGITLASSVVGAVIVALDGTVLTVAQPAMQSDLDTSFARVQWTSTGYLIAVAGLLVFSGRLGDRYGHQRIFALGILGFGAASAGIGLAPGIGWVVALRVVQGVFGALSQPATLGMLRAAYPPERLGTPIALRASAIGIAAAAGPLLGGALVAHFGWRSVFFLNVPPALAMGAAALAVRTPAVPEPPTGRPSAGGGLDVPGACLLTVALAALVHTLVSVPGTGWTAATVAGLVVAAAAGTAFLRRQRRAASPLVPPEILGSPVVGAALGILVLVSAALLGTLFVASYFLQRTLGLDPQAAGLRALPAGAMMILGAPLVPVLLRGLGPRRTAAAGTLVLTLGVLLLARLGPESAALPVACAFLLLGAGFVTVMVTATAVVVRHASAASAGVAGGLQQTAMNIGPTLGIAVAATLMSVTSGAALGPPLTVLAGFSATGTLLALRLPGHKDTMRAVRGSPADVSPAPSER